MGPKPTAPWQQRRGKWALSPLNITGCLAKCHQSLRLRFVWCCHRCTALRALAGLPNSRYVLRPYAVQRKAQACGLAARLAPKPCLAVKPSVAARCAAAGVAVSALSRSHHEVAPAHPQSLALAAPRPRRCSPSAPQGGSLYTALWGVSATAHCHKIAPVGHAVQTVKVGMHRRPPASLRCHTSRPSPAGAAQPRRHCGLVGARKLKMGKWGKQPKSQRQSFLAAAALRAAHPMRG